MATDDILIRVRADVKASKKQLDELDKKVDNLSAGTKKTSKTFADLKVSSVAAVAAIASVGKAMFDVGKKSFQLAAANERQRKSFSTLLQSVSKGNKLFKDLQKFSAKTPLQLEDITKSTETLLAFGVANEDVIDKLQSLGDLAKGNAAKLGTLSDAYGKLRAKGRASMEEINRFSEAGVPLIDQLSKNMEVTTGEVIKLVSTGKVGFEEVDKALTDLTSAGGRFEGMMADAASTTEGKMSTALDIMKLRLADIGERFLPIANRALDAFIDLNKDANQIVGDITNIDRIQDLKDEYDTLAGKVSLTKEEQVRMAEIMNNIGDAMPSLVSQWDSYGNAIKLVGKEVSDAIIEIQKLEALQDFTTRATKSARQYERISNRITNIEAKRNKNLSDQSIVFAEIQAIGEEIEKQDGIASTQQLARLGTLTEWMERLNSTIDTQNTQLVQMKQTQFDLNQELVEYRDMLVDNEDAGNRLNTRTRELILSVTDLNEVVADGIELNETAVNQADDINTKLSSNSKAVDEYADSWDSFFREHDKKREAHNISVAEMAQNLREELSQNISDFSSYFNQFTGVISQAFDMVSEARIQSIEESFDSEVAVLEGQRDERLSILEGEVQQESAMKEEQLQRELEFYRITNQQKKASDTELALSRMAQSRQVAEVEAETAEAIAEAEANKDAEIKRVKMNAFRREKAIKSTETVMNGVVAYTAALATPPAPNVVLAGVTAGLSAAQLALVLAQQPPSFANGGMIRSVVQSPLTPPKDQGLIGAQLGEGIVNLRGMDLIGESGLNALNRGDTSVFDQRVGGTVVIEQLTVMANNPQEMFDSLQTMNALEGGELLGVPE